MEIHDTNDSFDFNKLILTKPSLISGGNYFIRCLVNNNPVYIQPPKCKTKQGFNKAGKKFYCDLMFTNENENFIRWMENLENHCQQYIYKNREKWFDGNMELHDIENYFTSPLKLYKSGKYYIARIGVNTVLNKPALKIYDENENEVDMESINDNTNVVTIIEIQGIKCSSRSFQIELDLKQMMVLQPTNLFEKCIIKSSVPPIKKDFEDNLNDEQIIECSNEEKSLEIKDDNIEDDVLTKDVVVTESLDNIDDKIPEDNVLETNNTPISNNEDVIPDIVDTNIISTKDGMEEIDFNLEELKEAEPFQIKARNEVYYEMYREARKKAKIARDLALSSYLEAKRIKNTYMLNDIDDSDESDLEMNDYDDEENSVDENE
uniref:Uncharacterized protein n=1 Tax=viral metagenome TaxID=1070528 RepID=A0A6C0JPE1_9ZZZZ